MTNQALALKYRPQVWGEIVGNDLTVNMLRNSVAQRIIRPAYFFAGSKGSGKTTTARIFAKAIQCEASKGVGDPCNRCPTCKAADAGTNPDIIEVDAASESRVEGIRSLIRSIQYAPMGSDYKIVILDEVHALSNSAANALLKTLEEPPEHVVFLFCTTDPDKVIDTVRSRCLQFTFRRLSVKQIAQRLTDVVRVEAIDADPAALRVIAESANGAMRDALTTLDKAILSGSKVSEGLVTRVVGHVSFTDCYRLFEILAAGKVDKAIAWQASMMEDKDHAEIALSVLNFINELLLVQAGATITRAPLDFKEKIRQVASSFPGKDLLRMAALTRSALSDIRRRTIPDTSIILTLLFSELVLPTDQREAPKAVQTLAAQVAEVSPSKRVPEPSSILRKFFEGQLVRIQPA